MGASIVDELDLDACEELKQLNPPEVVNRIVLENMGLAYMVANSWKRSCRDRAIDLEDLQQEAAIGLIRAAQIFNPALGFKFSTIGYRCASQQIGRTALRPKAVRQAKKEKTMSVNADGEFLPAVDQKPIDPIWLMEERRVMERLRSLKEREKRILLARFMGDETLETIGQREGITRERVRQIEADSIAKLKEDQAFAERAAKVHRMDWQNRKNLAVNSRN